MKRNLTRQADLQLRRFCHRLTVKQRKAVLWILFVPFAAACVYTACRPFIGSNVRNGERKSQESNGTADETVQAPVLKGQEAAE